LSVRINSISNQAAPDRSVRIDHPERGSIIRLFVGVTVSVPHPMIFHKATSMLAFRDWDC